MRRRRGPLLTLAGLAVGGAIAIGLAWRGAAGLEAVPFQLPWILSGGAIGLAVLGLAVAAIDMYVGRIEGAAERQEMARVMVGLMELARPAGKSRAAGR